MADFKLISRDAVPLALEKAERYRLLNEPAQAESICLDVLAVDPENQQVLVMLILALTDQFQTGPSDCLRQAEALVPRLHGEYERAYYSGIILERAAMPAPHWEGQGARRLLTSGFAGRWTSSNKPNGFVPRATTTPFFAGIAVSAFASATSSTRAEGDVPAGARGRLRRPIGPASCALHTSSP